jgi:hypothetical protein
MVAGEEADPLGGELGRAAGKGAPHRFQRRGPRWPERKERRWIRGEGAPAHRGKGI